MGKNGEFETSDEQGMFAQQLRTILVRANWRDLGPECYRASPCPVMAPVFADVTHRGVIIVTRPLALGGGIGEFACSEI